jgi:hypothetical protein
VTQWRLRERAGGNQMKKYIPRIVGICIVVFVLAHVVRNPTQSAADTRVWLDGLHSAASAVAKFVDSF